MTPFFFSPQLSTKSDVLARRLVARSPRGDDPDGIVRFMIRLPKSQAKRASILAVRYELLTAAESAGPTLEKEIGSCRVRGPGAPRPAEMPPGEGGEATASEPATMKTSPPTRDHPRVCVEPVTKASCAHVMRSRGRRVARKEGIAGLASAYNNKMPP